jgi:hypothetical protein
MLMGYWQSNPPTHVILAARYLDRKKLATAKVIDPLAELEQVSAETGLQAERMPEAILEHVRWAEERKTKLQ